MADNVTVDNGDGTDYAASTEELSDGSHLQSVELHSEAAGAKTKFGTSTNPIRVDPTGSTTQPVSGTVTANIGTVATLATAAKQDTGNTSLSSLDGKVPALGQALAAASVPVVLPAAQVTTLTPPAAITGYATSAKQDTAQTALDGIKTAVEGAIPAGTATIGGVLGIPASSSTDALSNATSTGYEASRVVKAGVGRLFGATGYNSKTSAQFIQFHNATSVPADTAVPVVVFRVEASSPFAIDFGRYGRYFSTGIVVCNSSTGPTKTLGAADCWLDVQYL